MKVNNLQIRMKLIEKGETYYWLAQQIGISDNTLFRRLRDELPEEEQNRIIQLIEEKAGEQHGSSDQ